MPKLVSALAAALLTVPFASISAPTAAATPQVSAELHDDALEILRKSVAFRTVKDGGQIPAYAEYLKGVLVGAGFAAEDIVIEPVGNTAIFIARYRGTNPSSKPIVLNGHMDVVEARREDWQRDPFTAVVEGGYVFGRGAVDNKFDVSMMTATLAHLRRSGWKPKRDVLLALTGDEETEMRSTQVLAQKIKNAELVLNSDGGGGMLDEQGKPFVYAVQAAEKVYADFALTVTDEGGHSSRPGKTNAINDLAGALEKIARYEFSAMQNPITRAYFKESAASKAGPVGEAMKRFAADPTDAQAIATLSGEREYIGQVRTTCVATQIEGGHAPNALPQRAMANINCRIFPGTPIASVQQTIATVIGNDRIKISQVDMGAVESDASPLRPDVMAAVTKAVRATHGNVPIVPNMSPGATDSMHFRALGVPSYGVSGLFMKASDDFSHGLNERVPIAAIDGALVHWEMVIKALAAK